MSSNFNLIRSPYITEKVLFLKEDQNKVVFKVDPGANKIELKETIESIFKVKVEKISTISVKGKNRRFGKHEGKKPDWKKAVVKLKEGDKIEYFEGA